MIGAGSMYLLGLHRGCRRVLRVHRSLFNGCWPSGNSTRAAVEADTIHGGFVDYGLAIDIGDIRDIHITHRAVVEEGSIIPVAASIADASVAEAVIDATIEADTLAPVSFIPGERVAAPPPITGSPEQASRWGLDPRTRHPKIAFIAITPVAGRPQIASRGNHGLCVHRQRGRSDHDGHAELREGDGRYRHDQKSKQQKTDFTHLEPPCQIILRVPGCAFDCCGLLGLNGYALMQGFHGVGE